MDGAADRPRPAAEAVMRVGILGGGISGITLQRLLNHDSTLLESDAKIGGLCRTFWWNNYGYDIGGHILFSKHNHVTELVNRELGDNLHQCRRDNKILYKGRYVKYPFENDLGALDPQDRYECLVHYVKNDWTGEPKNLRDWAYATFGRGIAEQYLLPYNEKIWKMDPADIALEWVSRIPKPPIEDVIKSAVGIPTEGYTHQLYFRYPLRGGFESVVDALRKPGADIRTEARVDRIRRDGDGWKVGFGGQEERFDRIVVAFPIHEALPCFADVPATVREAVGNLVYNAMRVTLVVVNDESLMDKSAVYIPDPTVLPHRVCFMGFFSPHLVEPGTSSLVAETTMRPGSELDRTDPAAFDERIVADLDRAGVLDRRKVTHVESRRLHYAYPVYTLNHARDTAILRAWAAAEGIDLLGRFAEFDYINSDECVHRAMKLADRLNTLA
jgi:protoporphyrinogen oxidase